MNITAEQAPPQTETEAKSPLLEKVRAVRHRLPWAVRLPLALMFLTIGIIGGFIPVLQGWVFVLAAFWLLFPDHAELLIKKIKAKFSKPKKN
ncbi:MAG: hypothetical protein ONB41_04990 [candidate division KSB1 bacterium]|nr:hypothetical protein [candidate division KSB1 bacterium]